MDKKLSQLINAIRFPLIILVLYIHFVPNVAVEIPSTFSFKTIHVFCQSFISYNIGRIAVPAFFLISGYLFFYKFNLTQSNATELGATLTYTKQQCVKRLWTLLIPYFLWNALKILSIPIRAGVLHLVGGDASADIAELLDRGLLDCFVAPINFPLWYLRDLICMCLISPLFVLAYRYLRHWGILLLVAVYLLDIESGLVGFSSTAILYFGLGAYLSLSACDVVGYIQRFRYYPISVALVVLFVGTMYYNAVPYREYWIRPAILLGCIGIFYPFARLIERYDSIKHLCLRYACSVFFIYAIHEIYLRNWVQGLFSRLPLMNDGVGLILSYFLMPIVLLLICLSLDKLIKKYLPYCYSYLTGTRQ